ncbi:MAG: glycosyltransferase family 2 protein [Candidatus Erginobacter occultus]|nr:glycosyltransferase family 2 protein [Candidatus Erginobacter occultus]
MKVIIIIPAYNVAPVLGQAVKSIPPGCGDEIIVVDDGSTDGTADLARSLGLTVVSHKQNRGYGGAQKTGYQEAINRGADIAVMVHGDNQYDPAMVPLFIAKIRDEGYDVVTGTRMVLGDVLRQGMPLWKYIPNRFLTHLENLVFQTNLTDYHNGYRAYSTRFLRQVPLELLSEKFDFDTDIIIQAAIRKQRIAEVPHATRYLDENSQMPFSKGVRYGFSILHTVARYLLHKTGLSRQPLFETVVPV